MKLRWAFPAVAGAFAALWVVLSLPHKEDTGGEVMPFVTKTAGWPDQFARWSVAPGTGQTIFSSFSTGALVFDLVTLAAPVAVAWVVLRRFRPAPDEAKAKPDKGRGVTPPRGAPVPTPPRRPVNPRAAGGWG